MKINWSKKYISIGVTAFLVIAASILFLMLLWKFDVVISVFDTLTSVLMPLILGFGFAFLLNPLLNFFEKKCFAKMLKKHLEKKPKSKLPRVFGLTVTMIIALAALGGFVWVILPYLIDSVKGLIDKVPTYLDNAKVGLNQLLSDYPWLSDMLGGDADAILLRLKGVIENATPAISDLVGNVTGIVIGGAIGVVTAAKDFILAVFASAYMLYGKERFAAQAKKILFALFPQNYVNRFLFESRKAHGIFSRFISGQILDSICVGIVTFIILSIVQIPYALLIGVIVGVTNVIPIFGPFIGAIPSTLILLLEDPLKAFLFVVIILIIQQLDGNVIYPKVLGGTMGISSFWVLFSIVLGGGLFGFIGMLLGVPTWAFIYSLVKTFVEERLKKKQIPTETEAFIGKEPVEATGIAETEAMAEVEADQA